MSNEPENSGISGRLLIGLVFGLAILFAVGYAYERYPLMMTLFSFTQN